MNSNAFDQRISAANAAIEELKAMMEAPYQEFIAATSRFVEIKLEKLFNGIRIDDAAIFGNLCKEDYAALEMEWRTDLPAEILKLLDQSLTHGKHWSHRQPNGPTDNTLYKYGDGRVLPDGITKAIRRALGFLPGKLAKWQSKNRNRSVG